MHVIMKTAFSTIIFNDESKATWQFGLFMEIINQYNFDKWGGGVMFETCTVGSKVTGPFKVDDRILKLKSIFMQDNLPS